MTMAPEQEQFLQKHRFGVLTTIKKSGAPQATPVYYLYEDGKILISANKWKHKTRNIQRDPCAPWTRGLRTATFRFRDGPSSPRRIFWKPAPASSDASAPRSPRTSLSGSKSKSVSSWCSPRSKWRHALSSPWWDRQLLASIQGTHILEGI